MQTLRQLLFPPEFRISRPPYPEEVRSHLTKAIEHFLKHWPPPSPPPPPTDNGRLLFLADIGTGLWRMRRNMIPPGSPRLLEARPMEEVRKPFRWLVSVWDALKENGLEIQDHTGEPYLSGQAIKVQAFEPAPGIKEETVIDTIKPSIYLDGKMIQMGEVIVGSPENADVQPPPPSPSAAPKPKTSAEGKSYFAT